MALVIDKQTLDDLNIFGKRDNDSIYGIYNSTHTRGGAQMLEEMFRYPLSEVESINQRSGIIRFFKEQKTGFPFRGDLFDAAEHYLSNTDERSRLTDLQDKLGRKFNNLIGADAELQQITKGISAVLEIMITLKEFSDSIRSAAVLTSYVSDLQKIDRLLNEPEFEPILKEKKSNKLEYTKIVEYDQLIRFKCLQSIKKMLYHVYQLDVYLSTAAVAAHRGFIFPEAVASEEHMVKMEGLYHPKITKPIPNTLEITPDGNIIFLTGANMAGKSTFMKSLGIAMFLAHVGFPVPAEKMTFSVCDGLLTTINMPDNLNSGYSHFYTEVLRVKKMAKQLAKSKNLFLIFDELFRGTNVKDAYEATVAITSAFAKHPNCMFVVSTHIIEAGEQLKVSDSNIRFVYLPTIMEGNSARYTYKLKDGITSDRQGMMIINNENILDILNERKQKPLINLDSRFIADQQTLKDLNILGEFRQDSIFNIYKRTRTRGGKILLENMFKNPLTNANAIHERVEIFKFFQLQKEEFPLEDDTLIIPEQYLKTAASSGYMNSLFYTGRKKIMQMATNDEEYSMIEQGIESTAKIFRLIRIYMDALNRNPLPNSLKKWTNDIDQLLSDARLSWMFTAFENKSWFELAKKDYLLRNYFHVQMQKFLEALYHLDLFSSIAELANDRGFCFPKALCSEESTNCISIENFYHPGIKAAVPNKISLKKDKNVLFLTGANMAGKSTLMKSFSISVYLAHMGFPIASSSMEFSVQQGIYTSINVSDNLNLGHSHFYAEVLRVKQIANEVALGKRLVVVFDELFKGTNVKDAFDATVAVTHAFGQHSNCSYIISTHIIEVGAELAKAGNNLQFLYMPTLMKNSVPNYPYTLTPGITDDRHGMVIIQNEGILEIIEGKDLEKLDITK